MPYTLNTLTNKELFFILECKNLNRLINYFSQDKAEDLLTEANNLKKIEIDKNKITQSFMSFSDGPNYPMLALWGTLEVMSISFIPLTIITILTSLLVLGLSGIYFYSTYQELARETEKIQRFFKLAYLKQRCADLLLERLNNEYERKAIENDQPIRKEWQIKPQPQPQNIEEKVNKNRLPRLRNAIGTALVVSTTLVGTYYFGTSTIITAYGLTTVAAAMLGPFGLAAAFLVAFSLGAFLGYKYYKASTNEQRIKQQQKQLENINELKRNECYELKEKIENIPLVNKHAHQPKPKHTSNLPKISARRNVNSTYRLSYFPMLLVNQHHKLHKPFTGRKKVRFPVRSATPRPGF